MRLRTYVEGISNFAKNKEMVAIISLIIGVCALICSGITLYRQFFYKKDMVLLTLCDSKSSDDKIHIVGVYTNAGNQAMSIISSSLSLSDKQDLRLDTHNHKAHKKSINPIYLQGGDCKAVELLYDLPDDIDYKVHNDIDINLRVHYTNKDGALYCVSFPIGVLQTNKTVTRPWIYHDPLRIKGGSTSIASISL
jgi:hypothetical protein